MQATSRADGLCVAILGIGEAGGRFAEDLLALGVEVRAWDPDSARRAPGAELAETPSLAVTGAHVVLSLNSAAAAVEAARGAVPELTGGQVYGDLNSTAPGLKLAVAEVVEPTGALFADVALLGSVPDRGLGIRALASGSGASRFVELLGPLGMPVEAIEGGAGAAAARKLLRSVFMKGLAAAAIESLRAAERAECEPWLREEIAGVIGEPLLSRLVEGSSRHAVRRMLEMQGASELLSELGVEPRIAEAAVSWLEELAAEERAGVVR